MVDIRHIIEANALRPYLIRSEDGQVLTYSGLVRAACSLADWLSRKGLGRGDRLGLFMTNSLELACAYYACLFSGIVAVPINAKYSVEDRAYLLSIAKAKACLCQDETRELVPESYAGDILLASSGDADDTWVLPLENDGEVPAFEYDPDALFTITFTSGTTGRPKGICHSARTHFSNAQGFNQALSITPDHRFFHAMPMTYMAGILNSLFCPFAAGASVVVEREFDARMTFDFWTPLIRHEVNCMWTSPSVLSLLLQMDRGTEGEAFCKEDMQFIASCTAPLTEPVKAAFEDRYNTPVLASFGLSETLINTIDSPENRCGAASCGRPVPSVLFKVADDDGKPCAPGETGEMLVRSEGQMLGYLDPETGQPDLLPRDHWFPTGDMGIVDNDDCVFITDRKKDLIIRGGINISPAKVEKVICDCEYVTEAAVVGLPDPVQGERVAAAVRLNKGCKEEHDDVVNVLKEQCRNALESIAVPELFVIVDDFPRSSTGKVKKNALREQLI